jgi:hypothetical protein
MEEYVDGTGLTVDQSHARIAAISASREIIKKCDVMVERINVFSVRRAIHFKHPMHVQPIAFGTGRVDVNRNLIFLFLLSHTGSVVI